MSEEYKKLAVVSEEALKKALKTLEEIAPEQEFIHENGTHVLAHQYDKEGRHRLVLCCKPPQKPGDWTSYQGIATVLAEDGNGTKYAATTGFWEGVLPRVFIVSEISSGGKE